MVLTCQQQCMESPSQLAAARHHAGIEINEVRAESQSAPGEVSALPWTHPSLSVELSTKQPESLDVSRQRLLNMSSAASRSKAKTETCGREAHQVAAGTLFSGSPGTGAASEESSLTT